MAKITPNFNFAGRCEEALELYQKAFKGTIGCKLRYSDRNKNDWNQELTPEQEKYIYHSELFIGNQRIMMSDNLEVEFQPGLSLAMTITFDTKEEVQEAYELLKEESTILFPMKSTTYSSCMVSLIDKFGFRWGLMTEQTER